MIDDNQTKKILVLGAGIVGICNALALREKGFEVTLIDKIYPGDKIEASIENVGKLTFSLT